MVEYHDIVLTAGKQKKRGSLSWSSPSSTPPPSSMDFRSKTSTKPVTIRLADVLSLSWVRHFDGFTLKVGLQGGTLVKFSGFNEDALKELQLLANTRSLDIHKETVNTKGTNAGQLDMTDSALLFMVDGNPAFELPLHLIAQAVAQSRNEVALELHHDDNPQQNQIESLVEMRIHIPEDIKPRAEGEEDEPLSDEEDLSDEEERETPAQLFARDLQLRGDLGAGGVLALASFEKLLFSVPRGKYDVDLYPTFLKLASQTYTYKIAYKNVNKMFLFDLHDAGQHLFVIGLNPPVRQGRTAYPYLVVQFDSTEYFEQTFPNIEEATVEEKYGGLMKTSMKGPSHDVVTRVFKALMKKKVLIPGHSFRSSHGNSYIQCSYKANEGHLFFLEKSFFFLKKPPMHIRHASITSIEFDRMSSANKRFGMKIQTNEQKSGDYTFTNISRDEFDRIFSFLQDKGIHCITNGEEALASEAGAGRRRAAAGGDEDDPYLARLKADAEEGEEEEKKAGDEEDSEADEDFTVSSDEGSEDSSASGSDGEELESEVDEDMDEDEKKRPAKKKKAAAGKKKKKAEESASASDASEESGKAKKKKKGLTGYMLYVREQRPAMQKANADKSFGEITTLVAAQWKGESEAVQEEYKQRAIQLNRQKADGEEDTAMADGAAKDSRGVKRKRPERSENGKAGEDDGDDEVMEIVKEEEEEKQPQEG